jgi:hypothetical protein
MKLFMRTAFGAAALTVSASVPSVASPAVAGEPAATPDRTVVLQAQLTPVNGTGVTGQVRLFLRGSTITRIQITGAGFSPDGPHLQALHVRQDAHQFCANLSQDADGDGRISSREGSAAYGSAVTALTTSGDTSLHSLLAIDRAPIADAGRLSYARGNISLSDGTDIAEALRAGRGVIVISGVDYDGDGGYNTSDVAGSSDIDPAFPAEVTDPAACGVLR